MMHALGPSSIQWIEQSGGILRLIDQTLLPNDLVFTDCSRVADVWEAIKTLRVRGAPAIGISAAFGICLAAKEELYGSDVQQMLTSAREAAQHLATSRPTAVNLFWAIDRMSGVLDLLQQEYDSNRAQVSAKRVRERLLAEAHAIHDEDRAMCRAIGRHGAALIPDDANLITHCNTGGLATSEYGTALSIMFTCQDQGKYLHVFVDETRPLWQGARLTAWELSQRQIPCTLICDSMAAHVMALNQIHAVIVGADRITAQGDVANKIGTYGLAVLAKFHRVPFYVAAPSSTFDLTIESGKSIPIEQRSQIEITTPHGTRIAPLGVQAYNPAFDVTPSELVTALITERGIIQPVNRSTVAEHFR